MGCVTRKVDGVGYDSALGAGILLPPPQADSHSVKTGMPNRVQNGGRIGLGMRAYPFKSDDKAEDDSAP